MPQMIQEWGKDWWQEAPLDFNYYFIGAGRMNIEKNEELVVLLNVLPDDLNVGYHDYSNEMVASVNDEKVTSFKDFVLKMEAAKKSTETLTIETKYNTTIILDNTNIDEINKEILKRNNIPSPYSEDISQWLSN